MPVRNPKTVLCRNWKAGEACPYGDDCQYAHGPGELLPEVVNGRQATARVRLLACGVLPQKTISNLFCIYLQKPAVAAKPCTPFNQLGYCKYGDKCKFLHLAPNKRTKSSGRKVFAFVRRLSSISRVQAWGVACCWAFDLRTCCQDLSLPPILIDVF